MLFRKEGKTPPQKKGGGEAVWNAGEGERGNEGVKKKREKISSLF